MKNIFIASGHSNDKNGVVKVMKKYLGMIIALVAIIAMGSSSAIVCQTSMLSPIKTQPVIGTLDGGCGGHGCHNNSSMVEITGILEYSDSVFTIDGTILNFGCYNYLNTTISPYDFDGDGTLETILNELLGMVGTSITVEGYMCCHQSRLMVIYINGIEYREGCGPILLSSV